jgi:phospholipid/cholesterol/gamma-HCH transport system substrate-binding protein
MRALRGMSGPLIKFTVFAVVTLAATFVLAGTIANHIGGDTVSYNARFTDATGVVPGDDVRIAGVRVGQVDDVKLVDRKVALVEFSVQSALVLPSSTEATIKYRNLVGQRFVALEPGSGPPGRSLPAGATIPLERTHPAVNLTQLFDGFRPLFQALTPSDVNQLSFELVKVLQGEGGTISSLLSHTASLTSTIADKDQVIGEVIDNLNQVLDTVNARDTELTQLVITVRQLVSGLASDRNTIGEAIQSIGDLTDTTAALLEDGRPALKNDIASLGDLTGNLNDNQEKVEHFLTFLPHKLDALTPLGSYASWFNFYNCDIGGTITLPGNTTLPINLISNPADRCYARPPGTSAPPFTPPSAANPAAGIPGLGGHR